MKKSVLAVLAALSLAACGGGEKKAEQPQAGSAPAANAEAAATDTLNIYNWSNYVDESTVEDFKKANNLKLTYDLYENNETLEAKMLTGKSGYDLVVPGIAFLPRQIEAGAYQKINKDLIPNYKNIDPELLKMLETADPGNQYAVPYFSGVNTLAITAKGKELLGGKLPENGWDLLFKPEYTNKLKSCGIALWDTPSEMFPILLNYLGKDPKGSNPEDLKAAAEVLKTIRPDVKRFSPSIIDELARGDICLAAGNGGDLNLAKARSEEVKNNVGIEVLTPKGMGFWIESWLIPADAKKRRQCPQVHQLHAGSRSGCEKRYRRNLRAGQQTCARKNACRAGEYTFYFPERARHERRFRHASNERGCEKTVRQLVAKNQSWFKLILS